MPILIGRIIAASAYTLAAVALVVYSMTTRRRFFLGLVLPVLYAGWAYAYMAIKAGGSPPPADVIAYFQPAQVTLALSITITFTIRTWRILRGKSQNGF